MGYNINTTSKTQNNKRIVFGKIFDHLFTKIYSPRRWISCTSNAKDSLIFSRTIAFLNKTRGKLAQNPNVLDNQGKGTAMALFFIFPKTFPFPLLQVNSAQIDQTLAGEMCIFL